MIAACPQCGARYRIERDRIPAAGARLRCSRCEAIFRVSAPEASESPSPVAARPAARSAPAANAESAVGRAAAPSAHAKTAPRPPAVPSRGRVLVADPDAEEGKALADALSDRGFEPVLVHDGVEAILNVQRLLPKLVVLDATLPKMFGFQVCELMKRNEELRVIPVVLVGAIHHRDRYRRDAVETYGADGYIERPGLLEGLGALLERLGFGTLPDEEPEPDPEERAPAPPPSASPPPAPLRSAPPVPPTPPSSPPQPERVQSAARAAARQEAPPAAAPRPAGANGSSEIATENARAERLARIIVSDIVLYNPEKFEAAIRDGNVLEALDSELHEGRAHFRERIPERVRERRDFLGDELVRVARQRGMK